MSQEVAAKYGRQRRSARGISFGQVMMELHEGFASCFTCILVTRAHESATKFAWCTYKCPSSLDAQTPAHNARSINARAFPSCV